ncbi:EthD family reductase [Frankia sp. AiPs1]|uniref:EthD family reductase n=1 Tax=Frankia sp. AiPs1 TaxID=573493 RepID=UPI002044169D|nr:EthD family reductase [Frankia sp. AiPs1]MCM3922526.1 EthD family reductase [Frankia sp. AiPs1]
MIRFSVLYPRTEGATFDHDYYRDKHIPLASATWGISEIEIDRGLDGPYVAASHFRFASIEEMKAAMSRGDRAAIVADVANFTTITPVMQTSEVTG